MTSSAKKQSLLIAAAESGNLEEVTRLVERQGCSVNSVDDRRLATPLMIAAANSRLSVVKYLISKRASLEARDAVGWDALTWACYGVGAGRGWVDVQSKETILQLAQNVDRLNTTTLSGFTPLMMYVKNMGKVVTEQSFPAGKRHKKRLLETQLSVLSLLLPDDEREVFKMIHMQRNNFGETVLHLCEGKYGKLIRARLEALATWKMPKSMDPNTDPLFEDIRSTFVDTDEYKVHEDESVQNTGMACYDRKTGYEIVSQDNGPPTN